METTGSRQRINTMATMNQSQARPQSVTPQLQAWIRTQAGLGHTTQAMLKAMRSAGWQARVAREAIAATLQKHMQDPADDPPQAHALTSDGPSQPGVPVPQPDTRSAALTLDAGDRLVDVLMVMRQPHVVVFGNLLSDEECSALVAAATPRLGRSLTVDIKTGGEEINDDRTSRGMFFTRGENALVQRIETRITRLLNWPSENGEDLQVLQYRPGAEYKPHYDYFDPDEPGTPAILQRGGQRVGTLIIYLSAPEQGGATVFPDIGLEVVPQRGNAVFFSYDRPHSSTLSLHGGAPVLAGQKWIATKWLREREFT